MIGPIVPVGSERPFVLESEKDEPAAARFEPFLNARLESPPRVNEEKALCSSVKPQHVVPRLFREHCPEHPHVIPHRHHPSGHQDPLVIQGSESKSRQAQESSQSHWHMRNEPPLRGLDSAREQQLEMYGAVRLHVEHRYGSETV